MDTVKSKPLRLWALAIDHRQGTTISLHRTKVGARRALRRYVGADWFTAFGPNHPPPARQITDADCADYFEQMSESESYFIERYTVED